MAGERLRSFARRLLRLRPDRRHFPGVESLEQSGLPDLLLADLVADAKILEDARNTAIAIIKEDPELVTQPQLRKVLDRRLGTAEAEIMRSG